MLIPKVYGGNTRSNKYMNEDVVSGRRSARYYVIFRTILILLAALLYVAASSMYFEDVVHKSYALRTGAALFTAGASLKLIAELTRPIEDRVGLCCYGKYRETYVSQRIEAFTYPEYALIERWIRVETLLSDILLIVVAAIELARSILYIPGLAFTVGKAFFIASSAVLIVVNLWIIYQVGREEDNPYNLTFRFRNLLHRPVKVLIRITSAIGALLYLIGSALYLPEYDKTAYDQNRVAGLYEAGAFFLMISGLLQISGIFLRED